MRKLLIFSGTTGSALLQCSLLSIIYILTILFLPVDSQQANLYHITDSYYHFVMFLIALPSILVWFVAFFSYTKLYQFASALKNTGEEGSFMELATGLAVLAWSLPIYEISQRILSAIASQNHSLTGASIIIANYLEVILSIITFTLISKASRDITKTRPVNSSGGRSKWMIAVFIIAGIAYCFFTLQSFPLRSFRDTSDIYHLPAWLMVVSVIAPYLYAWFLGLIGAYDLHAYAYRMKGIIYKRALNPLVLGLTAIIFSLVAIQYLLGAWPAHRLSLDWQTLVLVGIRLIGGIGFVLIALGSNKLKRIEEV